MTISDIKSALEAAALLASQRAATAWTARVQELLVILKREKFGGNCYVCSGMGRSFLNADYTVIDDDPSFPDPYKYKDETDVLDFVEPGSRKCGTLVCTPAARQALKEIWQACELSISQDFKVAVPYRVFATKIER